MPPAGPVAPFDFVTYPSLKDTRLFMTTDYHEIRRSRQSVDKCLIFCGKQGGDQTFSMTMR